MENTRFCLIFSVFTKEKGESTNISNLSIKLHSDMKVHNIYIIFHFTLKQNN